MNVKELLKKEKGNYTNYELHYKKYAKYIPFSFINGRKEQDMKVVEYFYKEQEGLYFDMKLNFKGKIKDNTLIIVWDRMEEL